MTFELVFFADLDIDEDQALIVLAHAKDLLKIVKTKKTELLFVDQTGGQICPLVAMMFGRYRIQRHPTTGAEFIARDNGAPLASTDEIALPLASPALEARLAPLRAAPLTPAAFSALIRQEAVLTATP